MIKISSYIAYTGCACLILSFISLSVRAQNIPESKKFILIVGNNHSLEQSTPDLQYADDDAVMYYQLFEPYTDQIKMLTLLDDESQSQYAAFASQAQLPQKENLINALKQIYQNIEKVKAQGVLTEFIFVFIGHGSVNRVGKGYVHLLDKRFSRADVFYEIIAKSPADYTHLLIDACNAYSLVAGRGQNPDPDINNLFEQFLSEHDLQDYPNVGVLIASSENNETHEWSRIRGGIFSHQVRSALVGAADINRDNRIEYSEIASFVDAANARLPAVGKKIATFAWPPSMNRRHPLLSIDPNRGFKTITIAKHIQGKFHVESEWGERWAEFHSSGESDLNLYLPPKKIFYLRNDIFETKIPANAHSVTIQELPQKKYILAQRGAIDHAFEQNLFAEPFSRAFYLGYLSGRTHLIPVEFRPTIKSPPSEVEEAAILKQPKTSMAFCTGYIMGKAALVDRELAHHLFVAFNIQLFDHLFFRQSFQGSRAFLPKNTSINMIYVMPGLEWQHAILDTVGWYLGLDLGLGAVLIQSKEPSRDLTVLVGQARLGVSLKITHWLQAQLGGTWMGNWITIDRKDSFKWMPGAALGLQTRF